MVTVDVPDEVVVVELTPAGTSHPPGFDDLPPPTGRQEDPCAGVPEAGFVDVPRSHPFASEIDCLRAWGVTLGSEGGRRYRPATAVPRWQMALFIDRLARLERDLDAIRPAHGSFRDLTGLPSEVRAAVTRLRSLGVLHGTSEHAFSPHRKIRRGQVAALLNRLRVSEGAQRGGQGTDWFVDDDGTTHERDINALATWGILRGSGGGRYRPHANVTRGAMAALLARYIRTRAEDGASDVEDD